jgi:hypothetical protein
MYQNELPIVHFSIFRSDELGLNLDLDLAERRDPDRD